MADSESAPQDRVSLQRTDDVETSTAITGSASTVASTSYTVPRNEHAGAESDSYTGEAYDCGNYGEKFIGGTEFTGYTEEPDDILYGEFVEFTDCVENLNYTGFENGADFYYVHVAPEDVTGLSDSVSLGNG